jgi:hypothetical protein
MSDDQNDKTWGLLGNPLPIVMVVLLAAGVLVKTDPLKSARSTDPERVTFQSTGQQHVEARLWQDPFAAVEKHKKALKQAASSSDNTSPKSPPPDKLHHDIEKLKGKATVLAVSAFGGHYAEEAESRRRSRFAVISALGSHGYHPESNETIGYFRIDQPKPSPGEPTLFYDDDVPYEWFEKEDRSHSVLVLWLKDEQLTATPLATLRDLSSKLMPPPHEGIINVKLIGPAGSAVLRTLGDELKNYAPLQQDNRVIKVYSPSATISDCDFLKEQKIGCFKNSLALPNGNGRIIRTTGTDDVLADALLWELWQRGVNRNQCNDGLVLIGERDTRYGRTLLRYLTDGFKSRCGTTTPPTVRTFNYLRGLDGVLADADKSSSKAPPKDDSGKSKDLREQLEDAPPEHAEGRNQFDYLRRLADEIDRLDGDKEFAKNGVKAIGIVGSDVYDKLLILQALRSRFKDKIFFTTDLDARYLHADQNDWARNLVVASNFGLSLHPELQGSTLPFRDSYQTATYLATLMALKEPPFDWADKDNNTWLRPHLFEIGRTKAVHLASRSVKCLTNWASTTWAKSNIPSAAEAECNEDTKIYKSIEPIWPPHSPSLDNLWGISFMVFFGLLLFTLANPCANETVCAAIGAPSSKRKRAWGNIGRAIVPVVIVFIILVIVHSYFQESIAQGVSEPFLWLEGVSVWPSLAIRFVGLLTMLVLWYMLHNILRSQKNRISDEFEIVLPRIRSLHRILWYLLRNSVRLQKKPIFDIFKIALRCIRPLQRNRWFAAQIGPHLDLASFDKKGKAVKKERSKQEIEVTTLWKNYLRATSFWEMLWWILGSLIIGFVLLFAAFQVFDRPSFPHRGEFVKGLHFILVSSNALVLWLIIFWVGYETRACTRFIEALSGVINKWPDQLLARTEKETGVPRENLDDYLDFQLIVRATQRIEWLIYLPFVSLFFIVLARSNFFDAMDFPLALVFVIGLALTYALHSAWLLNKSAKKMRGRALKHYEELRLTPAWPSLNTEPIDRLMSRISNTHEGAFVYFTQQPALQALLMPFGGYGSVQLIEYLFKF